MNVILLLIAASLVLGGCGLAVFLWSLRDGQYEDLDGAAHRVLFGQDDPERGEGGPPAEAHPRRILLMTIRSWGCCGLVRELARSGMVKPVAPLAGGVLGGCFPR